MITLVNSFRESADRGDRARRDDMNPDAVLPCRFLCEQQGLRPRGFPHVIRVCRREFGGMQGDAD